jgi:hypothetical protein
MTENQRNDYENELIDLLVYMKGYPDQYTQKHIKRAKRLMTLLGMR